MNASDHAAVISPTKPKSLKGTLILYFCTLSFVNQFLLPGMLVCAYDYLQIYHCIAY